MKHKKQPTIKFIIGIDEVGRGPLAGPVAVGVVAIKAQKSKVKSVKLKNAWFLGLKDSKKLSEKARGVWFEKTKKAKRDGWLSYAVAFSSARTIDKKGIVFAINDALAHALKKINVSPRETRVLLDGGLRAPAQFINQKTIIKGDEKEPAIALASIMAKITRDSRMTRLGNLFPKYKFEEHKGYGTPDHIRAIKKYGITQQHRRTFLRNIVLQK